MRLICVLVLGFLRLLTTSAEELSNDELLLRQKFIYEILLRVEDPLQFDEWIEAGKTLNVDETQYKKYDQWMQQFYNSYQSRTLLPKGEFFGELIHSHMQQTKGLLHFFYYAKDWKTFQQNVCWARQHVNEGMFVYALNLAVYNREWPLNLPAIFEIFPQHFFPSKFISQAERFNSAVWNKLKAANITNNYNQTQQQHQWQWWKLMGLEQRWYAAAQILGVSQDMSAVDDTWTEIQKDIQKYFMPVDYTRDSVIWNADAKLSYFTEDAEWLNSWYRLNLATSVLLPIEHSSYLNRSIIWLQAVQKYFARYNLERLSIGLGKIEDLNRATYFKTGYNPQMSSWNGVPFLPRYNNFNYGELSNSEIMHKSIEIRDKIMSTFRMGNVSNIDMNSPEGYKYFAQLLHGDGLAIDSDYANTFQPIVMMLNGQLNYDDFAGVNPHVLLNYETMLRDPLAYVVFKTKFIDYLQHYQRHTFESYTREQLLVEGVKIMDVEVSRLVTEFEFVDIDVSNVLSENLHFVEGRYQPHQMLVARQMRLSSRPYTLNFTVNADKEQRVWFRTFIGPKYDENGKILSLNENRLNFVEIDSIDWELKEGISNVSFAFSLGDVLNFDLFSHTEQHRYLQYVQEHQLDISFYKADRIYPWPLPKGTAEGLPVQMFFMIQNEYDRYSTFPFDREVESEHEFRVPNVFFKDVKIYHEDALEKYSKGYANYGQFDYESTARIKF